MIKTILKGFLYTLSVLTLVWLLGFALFIFVLPRPGTYITPAPTDAIVVFTGGTDRLKTAFSLLKQDKSHRLLISGVDQGVRLRTLMKKENSLIKGKSIDLGFKALNTLGNAHETAEWIQHHCLRSIRLVTSSYHMPRSLLELRHALPHVTIMPHPVFNKIPWWQSSKGWFFVLEEYHKTAFVFVRQLFEKLGK